MDQQNKWLRSRKGSPDSDAKKSEMETFVEQLFTFWNPNKTGSIRAKDLINAFLSLGLAPNPHFVTKVFDVL